MIDCTRIDGRLGSVRRRPRIGLGGWAALRFIRPAVPLSSAGMEITIGIEDMVRALLDRMPDDCKLDGIVDRPYETRSARR